MTVFAKTLEISEEQRPFVLVSETTFDQLKLDSIWSKTLFHRKIWIRYEALEFTDLELFKL